MIKRYFQTKFSQFIPVGWNMPNRVFSPFRALVVGREGGRLAGYVQNWGLDTRTLRPPGFILLVSFSGTLLSFYFRHSVRLLFVPTFAFLGGGESSVFCSSCGNCVSFFAWGSPFWGGEWRGRGLVGCVQHASLSEVCPADKFQWHFTCGFHFRHSIRLPFVVAFAVLKGLK